MDLPTDWPHLVLYALTATIAVALVVAASTSGAAFGTFNPNWEGTADLRAAAHDQTELTITQTTEPYETTDAAGTVAFVLAPQGNYSATDRDRLAGFVENGGTLVVAEDVGPHGNDVLAGVGADARFRESVLRDEEQYYRSPAMPVATEVTEHEYTRGMDRLTLNHGTAVEPNGATTLVNTSSLAYLDSDGNEDLTGEEELGHYPVVTVEQVGDGHVVAVGDPSVFINSMLERPGNRAFLDNLLSAHERTIIDRTTAESTPPLAGMIVATRNSAPLQVFVGIALVAVGLLATRPGRVTEFVRRTVDSVAGLLGALPPRSDTPETEPDPDALVAQLRAEHPDWDEARVRRIIQGVLTGDHDLSDDDSAGTEGERR